MHRIFLDVESLADGTVFIKDEKAHYLFTVVRCKAGDDLIITDDKGCCHTARIISASKKEVVINITGDYCLETESGIDIILLQGLLKGEKMDFVIQKATELGVSSIIPMITERSQLRETRKHPRWKKIAQEASRQSGRTRVPEIFDSHPFSDVFGLPGLTSGQGIIFWEQGGEKLPEVTARLRHADKIFVLIGPEGGFSKAEVLLATAKGAFTATLGRRTLRAETASIAAISILQYTLGDMAA